MHVDPFIPRADLIPFNAPVGAQRVIAIGGLAIALGIAGLCTLPFPLIATYFDYIGEANAATDRGPINTWGLISTGAGCGLSSLAILGGLGCVRVRGWGRFLMLIYAAVSILLGVAGIYFHLLIIQTANGPGGVPQFATRVSALAEWVAWVVGTVFALRVLWVMSRRDVRAAVF